MYYNQCQQEEKQLDDMRNERNEKNKELRKGVQRTFGGARYTSECGFTGDHMAVKVKECKREWDASSGRGRQVRRGHQMIPTINEFEKSIIEED